MATLDKIRPGESARVAGIGSTGGMRKRLLDLGLTEGAAVICVGVSPLGDPKAFLIRGAVVAIRREDCRDIYIEGE